jgi:hypothetical protein
MTDSELQGQLVVLRAALEGYWAAWAEEKGRPEAATGATLCRFTAAFLVRMLKGRWRVKGGEAYLPGDAAGFFDGKNWHGHYWVTDGQRIVDLTANQFGADPIVITTANDPRYCENYSSRELIEVLQHVAVRARRWSTDFNAKHHISS